MMLKAKMAMESRKIIQASGMKKGGAEGYSNFFLMSSKTLLNLET